jgi:pimeloyl-ACP methyl ester carboxylesterase
MRSFHAKAAGAVRTRLPGTGAPLRPARARQAAWEDDPLIKPKGGRDTAARIPGAKFVSYPGMGHNLPEELWPQIIGEICAVTGITPRQSA